MYNSDRKMEFNVRKWESWDIHTNIQHWEYIKAYIFSSLMKNDT